MTRSRPLESRLEEYFRLAQERPHWFADRPDGLRLVLDPKRIAEIEAEMGDRYAARGQDRAWAEVGLHYRDPYLLVLRDAVIFPDGSAGIHHRTLRYEGEPAGVVILPVTEGRILLLHHYRHPTAQWHWEIPRGAIEPGASEEDTARTEIAEEIGGRIGALTFLGPMFGATGFMGLGVRLYLAELLSHGDPALDEGITGVRLVSPAEMEDMIRAGEITDSFTLGAFLQARLRGLV